jgi:hypothetical protein
LELPENASFATNFKITPKYLTNRNIRFTVRLPPTMMHYEVWVSRGNGVGANGSIGVVHVGINGVTGFAGFEYFLRKKNSAYFLSYLLLRANIERWLLDEELTGSLGTARTSLGDRTLITAI